MPTASRGWPDLTDANWKILDDLIPEPTPRRDGRGRPWKDQVADQVLERGTVEKLHHNERLAFVLSDRVDGADVGMIQGGGGTGFPAESFEFTGAICGKISCRAGNSAAVRGQAVKSLNLRWMGHAFRCNVLPVLATLALSAAALLTALSTSAFAQWTISNQQPVTQQFYPGTLFSIPLPASVLAGQHDYANSANIINNLYNLGRSHTRTDYTVIVNTRNTSKDMAFYYASASDPIYKVTSCSHVSSTSIYSPVGKYFHMTNRARPSNTTSDSWIIVWDQSTDIDSTWGGRMVAFYPPYRRLTNCSCTTTACANTTPSCQLAENWCGLGFPGSQTRVTARTVDVGSYSSIPTAPAAGFLRDDEIITGTVNHAVVLNTGCVTRPAVYPAVGDILLCSGTGDDANHLHAGNLVYIDSGYDCDSLPQWQQGVCKAMQTYGGYVSDTGGQFNGGLDIARAESGDAYAVAGIAWPFLSYIRGQSGNGLQQRIGGARLPFFNLPGVSPHIHVADPCVARGLAGRPSGCVQVTAGPSPPTGLTFAVQ